MTGVWGRAPSGVQGQSLWSGDREAKPPEAEAFLVFRRLMEAAHLATFLKFRKAFRKSDICVIFATKKSCVTTKLGGGLEQNWGELSGSVRSSQGP